MGLGQLLGTVHGLWQQEALPNLTPTCNLLQGSGVTSTIRSGVANINYFIQTPSLLAYGQLCVMLATGIWLLIATYFEVRPLLGQAQMCRGSAC